jgi:hypothetical protein
MNYIINTLVLMVGGIILANIIVEFGLANFLYRLIKPLIKISNLSGEVGMSAVIRTLSPSAGYSVLSEYYKKGKITEREIILTTMLTTFLFDLSKLPKYYIPVAIPLLGYSLALKFILIKMGASFLQTLSAIIYGRIYFTPRVYEEEEIEQDRDIKRALKDSFGTIIKVVPSFLIAIFLASLLVKYGLLNIISGITAPMTRILGLPGEAVVIVATQLASLPAGYAMAGEFLRDNILTEKQALLTIIIGLIITAPRIFLQYSLPVTTSLFGSRLGIKIVAYKIGAEILSLLVFLPFLL